MSLVAPDYDYQVRSFHPGFLDSPEPDTLPHGATPDAKNCLFDGIQLRGQAVSAMQAGTPARATLAKRTGSRLLTPSQVVAGKGFDGLYEFRKVGQIAGRIVAVIDGKVWYWDGASAFVQVGATAPFVPGAKVRFFTFRNLLFLMDGTTTRCWDGVIGTDLFTPGQVAPTGAPTLTVSAGPGVTGTYEAYAVWYDSAHDHESSPSPLTAQVVFANQTRTYAKPTGAPGANYDKWRVYTRSVTLNEVYFKRVADVAVATVSASEALGDSARNLLPLGPLPLTNDPAPLTFAFQAEFQGYRLGVVMDDDQVYASRLGDPQSQHPSDILGISRGSGGELRSIYKFGTQCVVQKASKTYQLKGDRMPFLPDEVHSTFGNVGPESAAEIKGRFFAWDEDSGPYWTDLNLNWVPIATGRIQNVVASVPKTFAKFIQCVHLKTQKLIVWAVPTSVTGRRRTLLAYHTEFDTWLPPITGLEYAALTTAIDSNGALNLYVGDYWGRFFQYFTDNVEGVPSGSLVARVLSATSGTVTCDYEMTETAAGTWAVPSVPTAVAFYTTGNGLVGLPVLHIDAAGNQQWRRVQSNTAGVLTLDTTNDAVWNVLPVAGDQIIVGAINWYWRAPVIDFGDPFAKKKGGWFQVQARAGSSTFRLQLIGLMEGLNTHGFTRAFTFTNASTWGDGLWGEMLWGGGDADAVKTRLMRTFFGFSFELSNPYPNQPVTILTAGVSADKMGRRKVRSGGGA